MPALLPVQGTLAALEKSTAFHSRWAGHQFLAQIQFLKNRPATSISRLPIDVRRNSAIRMSAHVHPNKIGRNFKYVTTTDWKESFVVGFLLPGVPGTNRGDHSHPQ